MKRSATHPLSYRILCLCSTALLLCSCLLLCACGGGDDPAEPTPAQSDATPTQTGATGTAAPNAPQDNVQGNALSREPSAETKSTCAYYFEDIGGVPMLYGAASIQNTSGADIVISEAVFDFTVDGSGLSKTMKPVLGTSDVVPPGESIEICLWSTFAGEYLGGEITVDVTPQVEAADVPVTRGIVAENLRIIQNYPGFATVSGVVKNELEGTSYALVLNYLSFFGENDELLGVWHFTKDAALPALGKYNFVMQMHQLPVPGLAESCTRIVSRCIGIE